MKTLFKFHFHLIALSGGVLQLLEQLLGFLWNIVVCSSLSLSLSPSLSLLLTCSIFVWKTFEIVVSSDNSWETENFEVFIQEMLRISNNNSNSCYCCCCCWLLVVGCCSWLELAKSSGREVFMSGFVVVCSSNNNNNNDFNYKFRYCGTTQPRTRISMKNTNNIQLPPPSPPSSTKKQKKRPSLRPFAQLLYQANICFALSGCLIFSLFCIILGCEGQLRPDKRWVDFDWIVHHVESAATAAAPAVCRLDCLGCLFDNIVLTASLRVLCLD